MRPSPSPPAPRPADERADDPRRRDRLGRALWWSTTAILTTAGAGAAFVLVGVVGALMVVASGTAGTTVVRYELRQSTDGQRTWPVPLDLLGGWSLLAVVGLAGEFGAVGIGISAVVIVVRLLPQRRKRRADDPLPQPSAVSALSTPQLCSTWRRTCAGLQRPDCPAARVEHLTALRKACLDELEQRDPAAFQRWLPSARAADDPAPFFCPQQHL